MIILILLNLCFADSTIIEKCNDGDTCTVKNSNQKIRLSGIDAPENGQSYSIESKDYLLKLVQNKSVVLKCDGKSYKRDTCKIFVGKSDIQKQMVRNGWALDSPKYSHGLYSQDQTYAERNKLGMWAKGFKYSPYCYRHIGVKKCRADFKFQD